MCQDQASFRPACCGIDRRRFLIGSGLAVVAAAADAECAWAQQPAHFKPCIDMPERNSPVDPPFATSVEEALMDQGVMGTSLGTWAAPRQALHSPAATAAAPRDRKQMPASAPARMAASSKWTDNDLKRSGTLRIGFLQVEKALMTRIMDIALEWTQYANINFTQVNDSDAEILVACRAGAGHWSYVGRDKPAYPGQQTMNLEITLASLANQYDRGVVLHEFGHALGCIHEHQNPGKGGMEFDAAKTIDYFRRNFGWDEGKTQFNVLKRYATNELLRFSDFDIKSIMLYSYSAEITKNHLGTPVNSVLSETDINFISQLYQGRYKVEPKKDPPVPPDSEPRLLKLGEPMPGAITPKVPANQFALEIATEEAYTLQTEGATQVSLKLFAPDNTAVTLEPGKVLTTKDLVNQKVVRNFATGKYRVEVCHRLEGGVGEYSIRYDRGVR
ncbi:MAG: M12 family metallopeptidase [Planctomycetota bacterium]|nr:M12 family metallopeptidase [Planctomycetota bacterium]